MNAMGLDLKKILYFGWVSLWLNFRLVSIRVAEVMFKINIIESRGSHSWLFVMSVLLETSVGDLVIDLHTDLAPKACKNFLKLCKIKYYNFSPVYSIQKNF